MRALNAFEDDPRQAVHQLFSEWVQTLRDRDHWSGTYEALAAQLQSLLATTRDDLGHIAKLITGTQMSLAPQLADSATTLTQLGWLVRIGEHTVRFSRLR